MLAIRMQRTGRTGRAMFRVVVQEARRSPESGRVVAMLGSYDPHAKKATLDKEKAAFYLEHGAQPSERTAGLLKTEGVKLPKWVNYSNDKQGKLRNPAKLRRNQPKDAPAAEVAAPVEEAPAATAEPSEAEAPASTEQ